MHDYIWTIHTSKPLDDEVSTTLRRRKYDAYKPNDDTPPSRFVRLFVLAATLIKFPESTDQYKANDYWNLQINKAF